MVRMAYLGTQQVIIHPGLLDFPRWKKILNRQMITKNSLAAGIRGRGQFLAAKYHRVTTSRAPAVIVRVIVIVIVHIVMIIQTILIIIIVMIIIHILIITIKHSKQQSY